MEASVPEEGKSREILAFGQTTVSKFQKMKIFIYGIRGLGIEIAGLIAYFAPAQLCIYDNGVVTANDLACNPFLEQRHVGSETRARASFQGLSNIRASTSIVIHSEEINEEFLKKFDLIVFTEPYPLDELVNINKLCRSQKKHIGFIMCGCWGLYSYIFVDYGQGFKIYDRDGEEPRPLVISNITKSNPGVVTLNKEKPHSYQDGDFVRISEVEGMTEVNGSDTRPIRILDKYSFTIEDTKEFTSYTRGGLVELAKVPFKIDMRPLEMALEHPGSGKIIRPNPSRSEQLHLGFLAIHEFFKLNSRLPEIRNAKEAEEVVELAKEINRKNFEQLKEGRQPLYLEKIDEELIRLMSLYARTQIIPSCSTLGSLVCTEIVKFTGKFYPMIDLTHFDNLDIIPKDDAADRNLTGSRYDDQIALFGRDFQDSLGRLELLLVGSGACGCELVKNFALMGCSTSIGSTVHLVDEDLVKGTNVNSHYWLHKENMKKHKGEVARTNGQKINSYINISPHFIKLSEKNDRELPEEFWNKLSCIISAVDKVEARRFLNQKALWYEKAFFDNFVSGIKCYTHMAIPFKTNPLLEQDTLVNSIFDADYSKVLNYPYLTEHTILWAKSFFDSFFDEFAVLCKKFMEKPTEVLNTLDSVYKTQPHSKLKQLFIHDILDITEKYPSDARNENGELFWSGYRKFPSVQDFDFTEESHTSFIIYTANLLAQILSLKTNFQKPFVLDILKAYQKEIGNKKQEALLSNWDLDALVDKMKKRLSANEKIFQTLKVNQLNIEENENERSWCIEFLTASSNLRAKCYYIMEAPKYKVEKIAFHLNRSVLFMHTLVSGLISMELIKYVLTNKLNPICLPKRVAREKHTLYNYNLATSVLEQSEPDPPKGIGMNHYSGLKQIPADWSPWQKIYIEGPKEIKSMIDEFKTRYNIQCEKLIVESICVLQSSDKSFSDKVTLTPDALLKVTTGKNQSDYKKEIEINIIGKAEDGSDCILPRIKYRCRS